MQNSQIAEKQIKHSNFLEVHSVFHTIQGEGPFCGTPAVFIRLAGCNLQCPACDTDYTTDRWNSTPFALVQMVQEMRRDGLVVITGGEPFRQDIAPLVNTLLQLDYYVQVESNGTFAPSRGVQWHRNTSTRSGAYLVCAPKTSRIHSEAQAKACALKYVVKHGHIAADGLPTKVLDHVCADLVARPEYIDTVVYVQPCDMKDEHENLENLQAAIASCMKHGYVLQLQVHKLINVE